VCELFVIDVCMFVHCFLSKAGSMWSVSAKLRNKAAYIEYGNLARMSEEARSDLFTCMKLEIRRGRHGAITRSIESCALLGHTWKRHAATRWMKHWASTGWNYDLKDMTRSQKAPRRLSSQGIDEVLRNCKGSNARATARNITFSLKKGGKGSISHKTVSRWAKKGGLVLSEPKQRRIRLHTAHHKHMRVLYCTFVLSLSLAVRRGFFSDEQGWPVTLGVNKKNDVIFVDRGEQCSTNIVNRTKGDGANCFSLFWVIARDGVVCFELFEGTMTVEVFHRFLKNIVKPKIRERERQEESITKLFLS